MALRLLLNGARAEERTDLVERRTAALVRMASVRC